MRSITRCFDILSGRLLQGKACEMEAGLLCGNIQEMFIKTPKETPTFSNIQENMTQKIFFCDIILVYLEQDGKLSFVNLTMENESCIIFSNWKMVKNKVTKIS